MKLLQIKPKLLFVAFIYCTSFTYGMSQNINTTKVSINEKETTLQQVFNKISNITQFNITYGDFIVNNNKKYDVIYSNTSLAKIFNDLSKKANFSYEVHENDIIIGKIATKKLNDNQQKKIVTGTVSDKNGEPLPGASILEKGTKNGVITNFDGNFKILVTTNNAKLVVSYIGYITQEIAITQKTKLKVILEEDSAKLEEVVVVGYGAQKKINLTGSVSSVSGKEINQRPITQGSEALQGLTSGVFINKNSGEPGNDDASIIIRGVGTLNKTAPLILVDGIQAPFNSINPDDIATISVLKDAASASIYGTRAANGVVLITTKRGKSGKMVVNYNESYSITAPTVLPKMVMNTRLYLDTYVKAAKYSNRKNPFTPQLINTLSSLKGTNWIHDYINTGDIKSHNLSIAGGGEKVRYRFSTRYLDQDGYLKGDWYTKRLNTRLNVDMKLNAKLKAGVSMAFSNTNNRQAPKNDPSEGLGLTSGKVNRYSLKGNFLYQILLVNPPYGSVYDKYGRYGGTGSESTKSQRDNPQGIIDNQSITTKGNEFYGNAFLEYEILKGLKVKYKAAINSQQESYEVKRLQYEQYDRFGNKSAVRVPGSLLRTQESTIMNYTNWLQAIYTKNFGGHHLNFMAGANNETSKIRRIATYEKGFGSTSLVNVGNGTQSVDIANYNGSWSLQSFFGRINYDYKSKYLLEVNLRSDGSSRFGSNNRWATFPGVSAGYVISKENFWKTNFISFLKLRASWGRLGVQSSNLYPFASKLNLGHNYNGNSGAALNTLGNPNLQWEQTTTKDIGMDVELWRGRISLEGDYFHKQSTGILTDLNNPLTTGISSKTSVNSAGIVNKGWEFSFKTKNNIGKLHINTGFNVTHVKNKVTQIDPSLTNRDDKVLVNKTANVWWIRGKPVNAIYGHAFGGIFQKKDFNPDGSLVSGIDYSWIGTPRPGDIKYVDQNGDKVINAKDMVVTGNRNPEWLYGFNLNLKYEGWDFGMLFQGVGKVNGFVNRYTGNFGHSGLRKYWLNGWTPENKSNTIPRLFVDRDGFNGKSIEGNGGLANSAFWVIDQSYLRLKNIVIGYTLPTHLSKKFFVQRLRVYVSGQNLWTKSKLDDLDPERNQQASHFGGTLPQAKSVTMGVNLTF